MKEQADVNSWIAAGLRVQGFDVSEPEIEKLAGVLRAILNDLTKLDTLKNAQANSTPWFMVQEAEDDAD